MLIKVLIYIYEWVIFISFFLFFQKNYYLEISFFSIIYLKIVISCNIYHENLYCLMIEFTDKHTWCRCRKDPRRLLYKLEVPISRTTVWQAFSWQHQGILSPWPGYNSKKRYNRLPIIFERQHPSQRSTPIWPCFERKLYWRLGEGSMHPLPRCNR